MQIHELLTAYGDRGITVVSSIDMDPEDSEFQTDKWRLFIGQQKEKYTVHFWGNTRRRSETHGYIPGVDFGYNIGNGRRMVLRVPTVF